MFCRASLLATAVLLSAFYTASPARATTYYVAKTGNNSNPCTQAQPCLTIARGQTLATLPGDIVQVGPGTYSERVTLSTSGSSAGKITFRGQDGSGCPTTLDSDVNSRGARPAPTVTMQGFTVNANFVAMQCFRIAGTGNPGFDIGASQTDIDMTDNVVDGSSTPGSPWVGLNMPVVSLAQMPKNINYSRNYVTGTQYGAMVLCNSNCLLQDNEFERMMGGPLNTDHDYSRVFGEFVTFRHNYMHGNRISDCADPVNRDCHIDCWQTWNIGSPGGYEVARHITIDRNTCFNAHEGIIARDTSSTSLGGTTSHTDWVVTNNVIGHGPIGDSMPWCALFDHVGAVVYDNNTCTEGIVSPRNGSEALSVRNNIFYQAGFLPYTNQTNGDQPGKIDVDTKNLLYEAGRTYSDFATGDILNQNPNFVNAAGDDWHILTSSPAKDVAVNVGLTADHDGNIRPQGAGPDVGAYEVSSQSQTGSQPAPPTNLQGIVE
jgi:hypothetical protein